MNESAEIPQDAPPARALPHNVEAEQAVLGAILVNNESMDRVTAFLEAEHFYDPLHAEIYRAARTRIQRGQIASPITLRGRFEQEPAMQELGGVGYLYKLAEGAVAVFNVEDYGRIVYDLAIRRELMRLGENLADQAGDFRNESSGAEQIVEAERQLYALAERGRLEGGFRSFAAALREAVDVANAAYQREGGLAGISTGLKDLDLKLGGLHKSDLLILAGRPSMGKTALATNVAFNVARAYRHGARPDGTQGAVDGGVVGFFSLEMSAEQLATRILSEQAQIASEKIRKGELTEEEFERFLIASGELQRLPLHIDDTPAISIATLSARARRLKRQHGLDLVVVDYLQLVRPAGTRGGENRVQEVSEVTQGLKALAKELNAPVVALSQLSRQVENRDDKRPQLSDLRESGSIEQDADVVMFVYREEYYVGRKEPREHSPEYAGWQAEMEKVHNLAEVIIGKQRHGPIGAAQLFFDSRYTKFGDLAKDSDKSYRPEA
ncbi:replicative DNA helicase [Neomegalonema sp.]|uniref:replicative DNA helicase n=1 Tax=Neomegalonema sp. TaxID=2039713 RepID=UPI00345BDA44